MPLTRAQGEVSAKLGSVSFPMLDELAGRTIQCRVSAIALAMKMGTPVGDGLRAFGLLRSEIEKTASGIYDRDPRRRPPFVGPADLKV